jgi:hypothetical protein
MKILHAAILLIAPVSLGTAALAKPADKLAKENNALLKSALGSIASTATAQGPKPPDEFNPKVDNDQGDDHANPGAILKVCSKSTPAAHRSAICPTGVSPD